MPIGPFLTLIIILAAGTLSSSHVAMALNFDEPPVHASAEEARKAGRYLEGLALAEDAYREARQSLPENHPDRLKAKKTLADISVALGRYDDAAPHYESLLRLEPATRLKGSSSTLDVMKALADVHAKRGRYADAERLHLKRLGIRRTTLGEDHADVLDSLDDLVALYEHWGRHRRVEASIDEIERQIRDRRNRLGYDHPDTLEGQDRLARLFADRKDYVRAANLAKSVLGRRRATLGDDHAKTLNGMQRLAGIFIRQGRHDEAEPLQWEVIRGRRATLGDEQGETPDSLATMARLYEHIHRHDDAAKLHAKTLAHRRETQGNAHPDTLETMEDLAFVLEEQARYDEAEVLLDDVLSTRLETLGDQHPETIDAIGSLGWLHHERQAFEEARAYLSEMASAVERRLADHGEDDPQTLKAMRNLAKHYRWIDRYDQAEAWFSRTLKLRRTHLGERHPDTLRSMADLAGFLTYRDRYDEAEALATAALAGRRSALGEDHPDTLTSTQDLGSIYLHRKRHDRARSLLVQALQKRRTVLGTKHPDTLESMRSLAWLHLDQDRHRAASTLIEDVLRHRIDTLGESHNDTLSAVDDLAYVHRRSGSHAEAERVLRDGIRSKLDSLSDRERIGDDDFKTLSKLLLWRINSPSGSETYLLYLAPLLPGLLILYWLSRSGFFERPGRIVWIGAFLFALLFDVVPTLNGWTAPFFEKIDDPWVASLRAFVQVAVIEEVSKLIVVVGVCWYWRLKSRPMIVIACGLAVGLSFGAIENIGYTIENGLFSPVIRSFLTLPSHAVDTACGAGFLALAWRYLARRWRYRVLAVLVPVLLHGAYNYPLFVDDRMPVDFGLAASLIAKASFATSVAVLAYLIARQRCPGSLVMPADAEGIATKRLALSMAGIGMAAYGIIVAMALLMELSIAGVATLTTIHETVGLKIADGFPMSAIFAVLLKEVATLANMFTTASDYGAAPMSIATLALMSVFIVVIAVIGVFLGRMCWRQLKHGMVSWNIRGPQLAKS